MQRFKKLSTFYFLLSTRARASRERGFSLLELVIVIGIIAIISAIAILSYLTLISRSNLNGNARNAISILNFARSQTVASNQASQWGVHFENDKYALFRGSSYYASGTDTKIYLLPSSLEFSPIALNGGSDILFSRITGQTQNYGTVTIRKKSQTSDLININIESSGQVSATTLNQSPAGARIADSRHIHFTYNGDARNATFTLNFPGFLSQNISIPDNTSNGQFDWSGVISVNNSNQILRVSTHALSATNADFSVARDRRYNNAALEIWLNGISGENLLNYQANGTESQGLSAWVSVPERQ